MTTQYRDNNTQRVYVGGSFRVIDPDMLRAHPRTQPLSVPTLRNRYMGFRTTLNHRQERCPPNP